jgi:hypothetical protein
MKNKLMYKRSSLKNKKVYLKKLLSDMYFTNAS